MKTDKKNYNEKINLILLKRIGKPTINNSFNPKKIQLFLYLYKFVFNNNQNNFYYNEIEFTIGNIC